MFKGPPTRKKSLLASMLLAFTTFLLCRRPAFWKCTVAIPTVRDAGLELADQLVGASFNPAFTFTAAMFIAETSGTRGGSAACYGARLLLSTAVCPAMWRSRVCVGGAAIKLAHSISTMLETDTTRFCKTGAAFCLAHFLVAVTAVPITISFFGRYGSCNAVAERAEPKGAM